MDYQFEIVNGQVRGVALPENIDFEEQKKLAEMRRGIPDLPPSTTLAEQYSDEAIAARVKRLQSEGGEHVTKE